MSAAPPRQARRRPRRGSLERPVSGRTYRGTWLLVALPLLLAAFTVSRPAPLSKPDLPAAFDLHGTRTLAVELANSYPDRFPGTAGAAEAAAWFTDQLQPYGFRTRADKFQATVPGRGRLSFENLLAVAPGRSESTIIVMAHRDNSGASAGANDNASGTAALIELARSYANPAAASSAPSSSRRVSPTHTIAFLSTDGGVLGGIGAQHFVERSPLARNVIAVINLDAIAGSGRPRPELAAGTSSYVYLGARIIRGWAIELVLVAALLPFLAAAVDLFALTRRRRIPLTPAVRSFRSRLGFWIWVAVVFALVGLLGFWPVGSSRPPAPQASTGTDWPTLGLIVLAVLAFAGWLVSRERLLPLRETTPEEELAGHTVALL